MLSLCEQTLNFWLGQRFIFSPDNPDMALGSKHHPLQWVPCALSLGVTWLGLCEVDLSPQPIPDSCSALVQS